MIRELVYSLAANQIAKYLPVAQPHLDAFVLPTVTKTRASGNIVSYSQFLRPLQQEEGRLSGINREHAGASSDVQSKVIGMILEKSKGMSLEDRALLLTIARVESGFNPDAAAKKTSASGVFQFIKETAKSLGYNHRKMFDAALNIEAGIKLLKDNKNVLNAKMKKDPSISLRGNYSERLYAMHHDGPSLNHGGFDIAKKQISPYLADARKVVEEWDKINKSNIN